jgi:serine/threonine protein kinase/Flp pilus assembly protein TadD
MPKAQDDDLVMGLVELAQSQPPDTQEAYLRAACGGDAELFSQVWDYVRWNHRMQDFLLEPLYPALPEQPFEPGELLEERFRIVREVARGGMGIVFEAVDEKLERRIALKCGKVGFRKRLPPEVRHATEISHPNVCKIFEIHTAATRQGEIDFLTMEFLEGESLAERLRRGPLPEREARTIAQQLCAGLAEAHRNHVIHGDLKSNNVILTTAADGAIRAVITDFGLARGPQASEPAAAPSERAGTPDYMAPELWKGEEPSVASDIYALGIILYELASGRRPQRPEGAWEERLTWKPSPVNPKWDPVLIRCLDPDPARRFQTAGAVAQALGPSRSRNWFLAAAAAAVLAVASGVVAYQRAKAPQENVHLAMLPLAADPSIAATADELFRSTAARLGRLKGNSRVKLTFIPSSKTLQDHVDSAEKARSVLGATHVLHGTLEKGERIIIHIFLTDTRSQINTKEWTAAYTAGEVRYAPVALAGLVTETLQLPPLADGSAVNSAALQDYQKGVALTRRDSGIDSAIPVLERAVAADPDSPLTFAALAEAEWFKYDLTKDHVWLDRTTEAAREAGLRNPDLAPVHRIAGLLEANAGHYELAENEYRRAIELDSNNSDAYRRLGQGLERNNRFDEALAAYRRAVEIEPQYYRNQKALATLYFDQAKYGDAADHFTKMIELAPSEPSAHYALGVTYLDLGRFPDAENELRLAIHLSETPVALHALGHVLMYEGKDQAAIPYIDRALSLGLDRYLWWMNLGIAYRRTNRQAESDRATRRALELAEKELTQDPRNGVIRSHLAYLCARLGDRQRATSEIAQALEFSPHNADTRWAAAITYEALGQRENTLAVLNASPDGVLADLSRWPDVADLHKDPRFLQLLASHQLK